MQEKLENRLCFAIFARKNISILKTKGQASLCLDYWLLPVIACYGKTGCDVERRSTKTFWLNISAPNYQI